MGVSSRISECVLKQVHSCSRFFAFSWQFSSGEPEQQHRESLLLPSLLYKPKPTQSSLTPLHFPFHTSTLRTGVRVRPCTSKGFLPAPQTLPPTCIAAHPSLRLYTTTTTTTVPGGHDQQQDLAQLPQKKTGEVAAVLQQACLSCLPPLASPGSVARRLEKE